MKRLDSERKQSLRDQPDGRVHPEGESSSNSFNDIVVAYEKKIFNLIYRIIGDYEDAADLTQETFVSAYRSISTFRGDAKIYTWLYKIALNHSRNWLRQHERMRSFRVESLDQPSNWGETEGVRELADNQNPPDVELESKELRAKILAAIDSLPDDYREVVVLREIEGLSYNEIVAVTGLSLDNVKTRLSRARAQLRRRLDPYYRS